MVSFVCKSIVCRFGVPEVWVTDNTTQFDREQFRSLYARVGIRDHFSSLVHSQANRQIEVINHTML